MMRFLTIPLFLLVGQIAKPVASGMKSLGGNIVTMNKGGGMQTVQMGSMAGKQTIVINKSGGQTIRCVAFLSFLSRQFAD